MIRCEVIIKQNPIFSTIVQLWLVTTVVASMVQQQQQISDLKALYREARETRILHGPFEAQPYYERILLEFNPTDITTSTRMAANYKRNSRSLDLFNNACGTISSLENCTSKLKILKKWLQSETVLYTSASIGSLLNSPKPIRAPIQIIPATAGTVLQAEFPFTTSTSKLSACQCLTSLFLLGLCVNVNDAIQSCSKEYVDLLKELGLICHCEYNSDLIYALVSIIPIDLHEIHNTLYLVTDWHPRVLNMIHIHPQKRASNEPQPKEETVMYIGPDSLALIEHWIISYTKSLPSHNDKNTTTILDLCTGSGIQALCCLMIKMNMQPSQTHRAVCVDMNPRALRFCKFSAAFNGIPPHCLTLVHGDIVQGQGIMYNLVGNKHGEIQRPLIQLLQTVHPTYDVITANPPFLPVPPYEDATPMMRYGLFSFGGPSGEVVLAAVLSLSKLLSNPNGGYTAIVSEFFFRGGISNSDNIHRLVEHLQLYWKASQNDDAAVGNENRLDGSKAVLFTNEFPISRQEYANRRADTLGETQLWQAHLDAEDISSCSPGLLFIQNVKNLELTRTSSEQRHWIHQTVPKSDMGSIWTPSNTKAIAFTRQKICDLFGW